MGFHDFLNNTICQCEKIVMLVSQDYNNIVVDNIILSNCTILKIKIFSQKASDLMILPLHGFEINFESLLPQEMMELFQFSNIHFHLESC